MSRSRAKSTATDLAAQAASLRLADTAALTGELQQLEGQLQAPAMRVRRAETLDTQLKRDTQSLRRLVDRAEQDDISRAQRDAIDKLTHRIQAARSHREQLGDLQPFQVPLQRAQAVRGELHRRTAIQISTRVRSAALDPPGHLVSVLGARPHEAEGRAAWDREAQIIETYRHRYAPDLPETELGLGPVQTASATRAWHAFDHQLEPVLAALDRPEPLRSL